jgi:hypothetical protein
MPIRMECAPAFNYAQSPHETSFVSDDSTSDNHPKAAFVSPAADGWAGLALDLRVVPEVLPDFPECSAPRIALEELDLRARGHRGAGVCAQLEMCEGQAVSFVLRVPPPRDSATQDAAVPTEAYARELGISFEQLVRAKSHMRAEDDPILTAVRPFYAFPLGRRSPLSSRRPSFANFTGHVPLLFSCAPADVAARSVDERLLELVDQEVDVQGRVEGGGGAVRARAEAAHLRADGRNRRQPDVQPARVHRRDAELGLPVRRAACARQSHS